MKKGSAKNFPEGKVLAHIDSSPKEIGRIVHHTNIDFRKFLVKFFSKNLQGLGQRPIENSVFFLQSFFFCASGVKRKSGSMRFCVFMVKAPIKAFSSGEGIKKDGKHKVFRLFYLFILPLAFQELFAK